MKKRSIIRTMLAFGLSCAMLAGCGSQPQSSGGQQSGGNSSAAGGGESSAASSEASVPNDSNAAPSGRIELNVGVGNSWETVTPFQSNIGNDATCSKILYETLGISTSKGEYLPWAAKSWKTDDNGFSYDFELYDYITDAAGNKITADDMVWMIEMSKEKAQKPNWANVKSVTKTGDYTFKVELTQNQVGVLENLLIDSFVLSRAAYEASSDEFATNCVTTSAYKLVEHVSGVSMTFEKRDDYWQKDASLIPPERVPVADKVVLKLITEASQLGAALESGDVDIAMDLSSNTATQFVGLDGYTVQEYTKPTGHQIFFSGAPERPVAEDKALRQAIAYCIDEMGIIAGVYDGYGQPMKDTAGPLAKGYLTKWDSEEYYEYNVEKAQELLKQSKYSGQELVILASNSFKSQCEMIQAYMEALGLKVKLDLRDKAGINKVRLDGTQYDIFFNQIGFVTLPAQWSIRFDPAAYKTGDGTSRHDYTLADMLYKTWTVDGFTEANIDAVHQYIKEECYGYGIVVPIKLNVWRNDVNLLNCVTDSSGCIVVTSSVFQGK